MPPMFSISVQDLTAMANPTSKLCVLVTVILILKPPALPNAEQVQYCWCYHFTATSEKIHSWQAKHQLLCDLSTSIFHRSKASEKISAAGRISGKDYIGQIGALQRRGTPVAVRPKAA